MKKNRKT